jgi:hypothetical protein
MLGKISRSKADGASYNAEARRILSSANVKAMLEKRGGQISTAAGPGHKVKAKLTGPLGRWKVEVFTDTIDARVSEARNKTLSRALDAARTGKQKGQY